MYCKWQLAMSTHLSLQRTVTSFQVATMKLPQVRHLSLSHQAAVVGRGVILEGQYLVGKHRVIMRGHRIVVVVLVGIKGIVNR
jgi:hypothetical protein